MTTNKNLLIILAAAAILLSVGVYYLSQVNQASEAEGARQFQEVSSQSSSDDTESIESDLDDTSFEDSDKELIDIEAELK